MEATTQEPFKVIRASDIVLDEAFWKNFAACESSYRRGYCHGVSHCLDKVRDLIPRRKFNSLSDWLDRLMDWRYKGNRRKMEIPPE